VNDTLRELQERAFQLHELTKHPGWAVLEEYTQQAAAVRQRKLLGGTVKSMDEYHHACGWLQGAETVMNAADYAERLAASYTDET
jgi:hypothetical protein